MESCDQSWEWIAPATCLAAPEAIEIGQKHSENMTYAIFRMDSLAAEHCAMLGLGVVARPRSATESCTVVFRPKFVGMMPLR